MVLLRDFFLIAPYIYYKYMVADEKPRTVVFGTDYTPLILQSSKRFDKKDDDSPYARFRLQRHK